MLVHSTLHCRHTEQRYEIKQPTQSWSFYFLISREEFSIKHHVFEENKEGESIIFDVIDRDLKYKARVEWMSSFLKADLLCFNLSIVFGHVPYCFCRRSFLCSCMVCFGFHNRFVCCLLLKIPCSWTVEDTVNVNIQFVCSYVLNQLLFCCV